jgi:short-subunit dehydrogenase
MNNKTALVTGASSGIGEAIAIRLASMGIKTYAAARRVERMEHLKQHGIHIVYLDLTDEDSIRECVTKINLESGNIDILVNNAGYGSYGAIEEVPIEDAKRQFEVNLFGLASLTQLIIPYMRAKRYGKIINVSSIGGAFASPYGGWYHATKFALEAFSSSLRQELKPFDIDVVIIRPGAIMTEWSGIAAESLNRISGNGPYRKAVQALHTLFTSKKLEKMAAPPSVIADAVQKAISCKCTKSVYTAPRMGRVMVRVMKLAGSDCLRDAINRSFAGLPKKM